MSNPIRVSVTPLLDVRNIEQYEFDSFEQFAAGLEETLAEYPSKEDAPLILPVAEWRELHRAKKNVLRMGRLFFADFDNLTDEQTDEVLAGLEGLSCVLYSTWGAKPGNCFRAVIELDSEYDPAHHLALFENVRQRIPHLDEACKDSSRGFFLPTAQPGQKDQAFVMVKKGAPLALNGLATGPAPAAAVPGPTPTVDLPLRDVNPDAVHDTILGWSRQTKDTQKRWAAKWALAVLNQKDTGHVPTGEGRRYKFVTGLAGMLAASFPLDEGVADVFDTETWDTYVSSDGKHPHSRFAQLLFDFQENERERLAAAEAARREEARLRILTATNGQRDQPCTLEEWENLNRIFGGIAKEHLMLRLGSGTYFVRPDGTISDRVYRDSELIEAVRANLEVMYPPPFLELMYEDERGFPRKKSIRMLRQECSTAVGGIIHDVTASETTYINGELRIASAKPVVKPVYHEDVHEFIKAAGGQLLLDTMAGLQRLNKPMPILVMTGAPRVGKSLLAYGCSQVRGGGHVKLDQVAGDQGRFNIELKNNPFHIQDESAGTAYKKQGTTILREGTVSKDRWLEQKNQDRVQMHGYARYIFCANNEHILDTAEGMNADDRAAFAERIIHVHFPDEMQAWCDANPHRIERWVEDKHLAEHLWWLGCNHEIQHKGERFLVRGPKTHLHEGLAAGGNDTGRVLFFLLSWAADNKGSKCVGLPADIVKGRLRIHPASVPKQWDNYCSGFPLDEDRTVKAVRSLAGKGRQKLEFNGKWYHVYEISTDELRAANRRYNLLTEEQFESTFAE